ncbi:MAG: XrtA system polysaccharide chain length determinant [Rubrivivax sp.]
MQELLQQIVGTVRGMWRFRWYGLLVAWIVAILGTVVVWKIPNQYEASARVYVDTDSILKPLMSGLAVQPNVEQQINMLSRTLLSRPNLEKLVRMADLDLKAQAKGDQDKLIEHLQKNIEMRTAGGANLYSMAYRDPEPEKAKRVVQAMMSIFVESGLGASRKDTDSAKTFLNEQIKIFEGKLEEAEGRLKEFRLRNIDRQGADGKDVATRMGDVSAQLESARLALREAQRARDSAKRQLTEGSAVQAGGKREAPPVSTPELDARIEAQRRNLDALLQRYTEQHPDVLGARRVITELEDQRRREVQDLQRKALQSAGQGAAAAPQSLAQQELARMLASAEVQVASMQARVDEFSSRLAAIKNQLKTAPQIEAEAAQLNRDYAVTKKNYEDLVARRQSAVMSGELDVASGVAEFRLIDPPRVAPKPVSPNRLVLLAMVLVLSLGVGLGVAVLAVQLRPTFGDGNALRLATGLPLLGVVTLMTGSTERVQARRSAFRFVGASGALLTLMLAGIGFVAVTGA